MKIVMALLLGVAACPVLAQDMSYEMCYEEAESNLEAYECGDVELNRLEERMRVSIEGLEEAFVPAQPVFWEMVQEGQKHFVKERDEYCEREAKQAEGGTLEGQIKMVCFVEKTTERVKELDEFAKAFR